MSLAVYDTRTVFLLLLYMTRERERVCAQFRTGAKFIMSISQKKNVNFILFATAAKRKNEKSLKEQV